MDIENCVSGSPSRSFSDPEQFQSATLGGDSMYTVLGRGAFRAELTSIGVGRLLLQRGHEELPRVSATSIPANRIGLIGWPSDGQLPVVRGAQIQRGEFICLGPGMQSHHRITGTNDFAVLSLDPANLVPAAMDLTGRELAVPAGKVLRPPGHLGTWLLSVIDAATRASLTTPGIFASPAAAEALEQALLQPMIGCLLDGDVRDKGVPRGHRTAVVRRFEAAVEANLDGPLLITDLCRTVNVTARSLNILCQEQLGMSAQQFLSRRRLYLTRRALLRSERAATTVTEIAMSYGIWELGRFAVAYKSLFGESPSATLRRQPELSQPEAHFTRQS
jgi:AraC-like DNA-binding protein